MKTKIPLTAELTEREIDVVVLICKDYSSEEIAGKLNISKRTVDTHRGRILSKLGARSVVGILTYAIKNKLYRV